MRSTLVLLVALFAAPLTSAPGALEFTSPERLSPDDGAKHRLSRNPGAHMAFEPGGDLHVVAWYGLLVTDAEHPSGILYRRRSAATDEWSAPVAVDDSFGGDGRRIGGREPSLLRTPDGAVHVFWHDFRHCLPEPPHNGIDNVEIYGDVLPPGGAFSATDRRLTQTTAAHYGDNGYAPRATAFPDGRIALLWHDFHADYGVSDLYLKMSDATGAFGDPAATPTRLTDLNDRGGSASAEAYSLPDAAIDAAGRLQVVWTTGNVSVEPALLAAAADSPPGILNEAALAADTGGYYYPPKILAGPDGGVWALYSDRTAGVWNVALRRKDPGTDAYDAPILLTNDAAIQRSLDGAFDARGRLHLVWIDDRGGRRVRYALYDPASGLGPETPLTPVKDAWARPSIEVSPDGLPHVLVEEDVSASAGAVWYVRAREPKAAADAARWGRYE